MVAATLCNTPFLQFAEGFRRPHAGVQDVNGLAGDAQVHGRHSELHAAAALQEENSVILGDADPACAAGSSASAMMLSNSGERWLISITDMPLPRQSEQFFTNAFEDWKGQSTGAGVEVVNPLGGGRGTQGRSHVV